jgi:hypothetical protein
MRGIKQKAWLVYWRNKHIDTVYFLPTCDLDYVKTSLINHDGYPSDIVVYERSY